MNGGDRDLRGGGHPIIHGDCPIVHGGDCPIVHGGGHPHLRGGGVMTVQRFAVEHLLSMPWKNGGGATREIVCQPPGAGMDAFDWRVSIATIDRPGPFSAFPGVARTIMLLEGCGVRLRSAQAAIDHRLDTPLAPFDFDGGTALDCDLLGGTSTDFNVMVRPDRLAPQCRVLRAAHALAPAPHGL